jgi:transposase
MARLKKSVDEEIILKAKEEFEKLSEGKLAMRLRVIIAFGDFSSEEVAKVLKVSRRSIFRWVNEFREEGINGLMEKSKGHYKSKLTGEQKKQIKKWINNGSDYKGEKVHWTLEKLKIAVHREFGVVISATSLWRNLRKMGLVIKSPRPIHYKADKQEQEDFKKNQK